MIIRRQDKRAIVNMNNVDTIAIVKNEIQYFNGGTESMDKLGVYSNEEKAIEVLDMICDFYLRDDRIFEMPADKDVEKLIEARRRHVMTLGVPEADVLEICERFRSSKT